MCIVHTQARESRQRHACNVSRPDAHGIHTPTHTQLQDALGEHPAHSVLTCVLHYAATVTCARRDAYLARRSLTTPPPAPSYSHTVIQYVQPHPHIRCSPRPRRRTVVCASAGILCVKCTYTLCPDQGPTVGVVTRWSMIVPARAQDWARITSGEALLHGQARSSGVVVLYVAPTSRGTCRMSSSRRWQARTEVRLCPAVINGRNTIRPRPVHRELLAATLLVKGRNRSMRGFRRLVGMTSPARSIELLKRPSTEVECCCNGTDSAGAWRTGG